MRGLDASVRALVGLHRAELGLRLVILLATVVFSAVEHLAGHVPWWVTAVALALAAVTMLAPDSEAGTVTTVFLGATWFYTVADPTSAWTLPAAVSLLVLHVATAAAARVPARGRLPAGSLPRWLARTGIVAGITVVAYAVSRAFAALAGPASVVLLTVALAVAAGGVLAARHLSLATREGRATGVRVSAADRDAL